MRVFMMLVSLIATVVHSQIVYAFDWRIANNGDNEIIQVAQKLAGKYGNRKNSKSILIRELGYEVFAVKFGDVDVYFNFTNANHDPAQYAYTDNNIEASNVVRDPSYYNNFDSETLTLDVSERLLKIAEGGTTDNIKIYNELTKLKGDVHFSYASVW